MEIISQLHYEDSTLLLNSQSKCFGKFLNEPKLLSQDTPSDHVTKLIIVSFGGLGNAAVRGFTIVVDILCFVTSILDTKSLINLKNKVP